MTFIYFFDRSIAKPEKIHKKLLFAYARTAALHYTPGARRCAENCSESWQLLSESCQNLGDFCQNLARKMQSRWPNTMPRNCKKIIQKSVPKHQIHQNCPKNAPRSKKIAPRSRKEAKMVPLSQTFGSPQGIKNQPKSKKGDLGNRCFFRLPPGTDFASF